MHWKKINQDQSKKISNTIINLFYSQFKKRGIDNMFIIKNWNKIFSLKKNIDPDKFKLIKINKDTLFILTDDINFYSEFLYLKGDIIECLNNFNKELNIKDCKIKLNS